MSSELRQKDNLVNTDYWGAGIMFFFAIVFYSQMDPDWTDYGQFFPNRILIFLVVIGICLLIKGKVSPTKLPSFVSQVNSSMLFTMAVGLVWVFALEWVGFIITSFLAIFAMLWRFDKVRSPKTLFKSALIAAGEVMVIHVGFVKLLQVTMPEGRLFY